MSRACGESRVSFVSHSVFLIDSLSGAGAAWRHDSSSPAMPPKRVNDKVSRRSRDKVEEEAFVISKDHDSLISSNIGNDISDYDNDISGGEEEDAGNEENASPNKSVARPRAAIRGKANQKKSRATPKETFEDLEDQFITQTRH